MLDSKTNPILCALDTKDLVYAQELSQQVRAYVGGIKLGLEFFTRHGPQGVEVIAKLGIPIFLDLKFHDIPNTVAEAVHSAMALEVDMLTLHLSGGEEMLKRAVDIVHSSAGKPPLLIGVSVLTSMDETDLKSLHIDGGIEAHVQRLAHIGEAAGLDGMVCSAYELAAIRSCCKPSFLTVVPGIRTALDQSHDQKRVMTPEKALAQGADFLVIGRSITGADNPAQAAESIYQSLPR